MAILHAWLWFRENQKKLPCFITVVLRLSILINHGVCLDEAVSRLWASIPSPCDDRSVYQEPHSKTCHARTLVPALPPRAYADAR